MTMTVSTATLKRVHELTQEAQMHRDMGNKFGMFACLREIDLLVPTEKIS